MGKLGDYSSDIWEDTKYLSGKIGFGIVVVLGVLIVIGAVSLALAMFNGWILMLVLGGLHGSVTASVPALGYWPSVLVAFAITFVTGLARRSYSYATKKDD